MSDETKRETKPAREDEVVERRETGEGAAPAARRPAVRFWEITLSPELDAALHVKAI
jgi:hypothetical protein